VTHLEEALTALADVLAKRPAEEILFDWFRSGRLVGELSVLIKRRHPDVQAEIDRVYQEHLAQLGKRRRDPGKTIDYFWRGFSALPSPLGRMIRRHALDAMS
jgi:hypothetical protein